MAARGAREHSLRLVGEESLHVTLCFLGSRSVAEVEPIAAACSLLAGHRAGGLAVGQPVWLPRRRPRVLSVAIDDDGGELREIQGILAGSLARDGLYEPEARLFFPHVTVARVRSGERVRPARLPGPEPVEFAAEALTLYRSRLAVGPAVYEALHRVALMTG